ncbi:hypothetical protein [Mesorhizobium delmotii]
MAVEMALVRGAFEGLRKIVIPEEEEPAANVPGRFASGGRAGPEWWSPSGCNRRSSQRPASIWRPV